ncbi:MAG: peptidylprolyl isomerase [Colwelliaceae bacterium]|jgi:peptidyl-prolyl cis-trans isomerase A (cyclophilin A)|nr:peptidylprolyl isomerase [Colwelliaceae bacterium]
MTKNTLIKLITTALFNLSVISFASQATIVEFQTSQGNFKVNLHDETTPKTVENFLNYVIDGDYSNTVVHRVVPNFVVQGGGFYFDGEMPLSEIDTDAAVINEPVYSNVRGTIAMAKKGGDSNSATSQWFVNLVDSSANLDLQNGGFTVFGEVINDDDGDGMEILDAIAALGRCSDIPFTDEYTAENCNGGITPAAENFVTIYDIIIYDDTVITDQNLSSVKNTLINEPTASPDNGSSGGSLTWLSLLLIGMISFIRKIV